MNIMYKVASAVASLRNTYTFPYIEQNTTYHHDCYSNFRLIIRLVVPLLKTHIRSITFTKFYQNHGSPLLKLEQ